MTATMLWLPASFEAFSSAARPFHRTETYFLLLAGFCHLASFTVNTAVKMHLSQNNIHCFFETFQQFGAGRAD